MHKETVHSYEMNSAVYFIPINDFKERVINVHQSNGTMPDLIEESLLKRNFLKIRKGHN